MKSILAIAIAAAVLTACASPGGPGSPASGVLYPSRAAEADLYARYQKYRSGPPPYLDFETWKKMYGNPPDYSGSGQ